MCICLKLELYDYGIGSLVEYYEAPDWVSQYQCDVGPLDRLERCSWIDDVRRIKAFTIADVYRVVETEHGDVARKPVHRVLELKGDKYIEIYPCTQAKSQSQIDFELSVLREAGLWKD